MYSCINPIKCLIVEDDKFKLDSVRIFLHEALPGRFEITESGALSSATCALAANRFDLMIIDMSIPSHEPKAGAGSPVPLPNGGLDVLFEANYLNQDAVCVVLTQYPDIPIEGLPVPIELAAAAIATKFGIIIAGCLKYSETEDEWKLQLKKVLETL